MSIPDKPLNTINESVVDNSLRNKDIKCYICGSNKTWDSFFSEQVPDKLCIMYYWILKNEKKVCRKCFKDWKTAEEFLLPLFELFVRLKRRFDK